MKLLAHQVSNENRRLCSMCGGKCCKNSPGVTLPADWGAPDKLVMANRIVNALCGGKWCIDWWEGDPRVGGTLDQCYYVRPAQVGHEGRLLHGSWGGQCGFLGTAGCSLSFKDRPSECRSVTPHREMFGSCDYDHTFKSKQQELCKWIEYQPMMETIIKELESKDKEHAPLYG